MVMEHGDEEIYVKYGAELLRFAATLVGPTAAEDTMTLGVLKSFASPAWRAGAVVDERSYLYRSVLNEARQLSRSTQRRLLREHAAAHPERLDESYVRLEVLDALGRLSLRQRAVLFLTYWLELPVDAVAEWLGTSRRTTERELTVARSRMKEMLQ
jgi:RNA polymerase sigma factor (sigma-70 family)